MRRSQNKSWLLREGLAKTLHAVLNEYWMKTLCLEEKADAIQQNGVVVDD